MVGAYGGASLSVQELSVRYRNSETDAVSRANLEIDTEKVAILGPNGSGKSTLLRAILGLAPARTGSVRIFGQDIASLRGGCSVGTNLTEVYRLMTTPVDRLISIWARLQGSSDDQMRRWVREFGLDDATRRPLHQLSTGQAKLMGDLLALAFAPRLVLLDEPFESVDFGRRRKYVGLLTAAGAPVVMNTHELDLLPSFPDWRLYFMFEGQLLGPFATADVDRLYLNRGLRSDAAARFVSSIGEVSITLDHGDVPIKGTSNLSYLLEKVA